MPINPQDKYGKKFKLNQYGLARQNRAAVIASLQFNIGYGISTVPGQSGSPVVDDNSIIAVHVGGADAKQFNLGRIIDEGLIKRTAEWVMQIDASLFSLE